MKKQTAVDMFILTITEHIEAIFNGSIQQDEFAKRMRQSYNEAKAMEKEQMDKVSEDWFVEGCSHMMENKRIYQSFEQYYTSTYGQ